MTMQLIDAVRHYRNAMVVQGRSPYTVRGAKSALKSLMAFLAASQITQIEQLDHDVLMRYREALSWRVTPKGTVLNPRSQSELLGHMRVFCRWLVEQDWLPIPPGVFLIRAHPNSYRKPSWRSRKCSVSCISRTCARRAASVIA
jgi:site-specific recombinase XerC